MPWGPGNPECKYSWGVLGGGAQSMLGGRLVEKRVPVIVQRVFEEEWGHIETLFNSGVCGLAKLAVKPGSEASFHAEGPRVCWVLEGEGALSMKDGGACKEVELRPLVSYTQIPEGATYKIACGGGEGLTILEARLGGIGPVGGRLVSMRTRTVVQKVLEKRWGFIEGLYECRGFGLARFTLRPRTYMSLQVHLRKDEVYWIQKGRAVAVTKAGDEYRFVVAEPGTAYRIPPPTIHQPISYGDEDLVLIEPYLGELTDVIRVDDPEELKQAFRIHRELGLMKDYRVEDLPQLNIDEVEGLMTRDLAKERIPTTGWGALSKRLSERP